MTSAHPNLAALLESNNGARPWHLISIDLGTSTISCSYGMLHPGAVLSAGKIEKVRLSRNSNCEYLAPAIAAFHNGEWVVAHDLESRQNEIPEHKIIACFKLLLYDTHRNIKQARRVDEQLLEAGQSLHSLLTATLDFVWQRVWKHIEEEVLHHDESRSDYEAIVYMSVPKLVTPQATKVLKDAAKAAGLPRVRFVYEPLCAASCVLEEMIRKSTWFTRRSRFEGSSALCLDAGGGTTDAILVKLLPTDTGSIHGRIKVIGPPDCTPYGSTSIDESFQEMIKNDCEAEEGGFAEIARRMGFSESNLLRRATHHFQKHKVAFPQLLFQEPIYIRGPSKVGFEAPLTEADMEQLFTESIQPIVAMVRRNIREDTKACPRFNAATFGRRSHIQIILLSGGLGANIHFQQALRDEFSQQGIEIEIPAAEWREGPVAQGALLVEHLTDQSQLRAMYSVGIVFEVEPLDKKIHYDALDHLGNHRQGVVKWDVWYSKRNRPEYIVEDRITWLLTQNSNADPNGYFQSRTVHQQFHVPLSVPEVAVTTVFTTKTSVRDHEPLRDADGNVHHGLESETRTLRLPNDLMERFKRNGWDLQLSPGWSGKKMLPKKPYLELWCQLAIRHDNKSIDVGIKIITPESIPYRPGGELELDALAGYFDNAQWINIWDVDFDTHVLDTSGREDTTVNARMSSGIHHDFNTEVIMSSKQSQAHDGTPDFEQEVKSSDGDQ